MKKMNWKFGKGLDFSIALIINFYFDEEQNQYIGVAPNGQTVWNMDCNKPELYFLSTITEENAKNDARRWLKTAHEYFLQSQCN
jgi:hypothetical protein